MSLGMFFILFCFQENWRFWMMCYLLTMLAAWTDGFWYIPGTLSGSLGILWLCFQQEIPAIFVSIWQYPSTMSALISILLEQKQSPLCWLTKQTMEEQWSRTLKYLHLIREAWFLYPSKSYWLDTPREVSHYKEPFSKWSWHPECSTPHETRLLMQMIVKRGSRGNPVLLIDLSWNL